MTEMTLFTKIGRQILQDHLNNGHRKCLENGFKLPDGQKEVL